MIKKVINKYKHMSNIAKASLWFMICTMLQKCLALLTTPVFTRIMDTEQYGYYSTYLSITTIITVIFTLNFDTCAYMNGIAKFETEEEKNELASSLLSLTCAITIIAAAVAFIFLNKISALLALPKNLILVMLLEILFIPPVKFWLVKQRFSYRYISVVSVTLGMLFCNNLLGIIMVLYGPSEQAVMRVLSIAIVQLCVGIILYGYFFCRSGVFHLTKYWRYGLKLNIPLIPHGLSLMILSSSDKVMINSMVGSVQAGIYGVAYSAGQIINAIKLSLVDAMRPWIYEKLNRKAYKDIKGICQLVFVANILMTFMVVGLAPEIIEVLAPSQYHEAIYIIPPVAASSYFTFIYNICSIVEIYYEKNKNVMIASVVAAVTNIALNYLLIPVYGYLAAGYTTLFSYIVLSMLHFAFLERIRKKQMQGISVIDLRFTLLMSAVVLGIMIIYTYLYSHTLLRLVTVIISGVICFFTRDKFIGAYKSLKSVKSKEEGR